jgi:hypothetical protein
MTGSDAKRALLVIAASILLSLAAIDFGLGLWLGAPPIGPAHSSGALQRYFEYGRSVEGKIRQMVGPTEALSHPLALTGWLDPPTDQPTAVPEGSDLLVAVYGMSFSANAANAMHAQDQGLAVRNAGGPGATLGHSYAMYRRDRGEHAASVVVLGVLASSFPGLSTMTHATWNFEAPSPHFYPRFTLENGALVARPPAVASLDALRGILADDAAFTELLAQLEASDAFYDPFTFRASWLDRSVIARTLRRAWGQRAKRDTIARFHDAHGYTNEEQAVDVARAIVRAFVADVRAEGRLPVLLLIHDRGYADHLYQALRPVIEETRVDTVSTHEIAPAGEPANFVQDGHFTPEIDVQIGAELAERINAALERTPR